MTIGLVSRILLTHQTYQHRPGARAAGLDPRYHYVINGVYVSVIEGDVWVLALGIRDSLPADGKWVGFVSFDIGWSL